MERIAEGERESCREGERREEESELQRGRENCREREKTAEGEITKGER